MTYNPNAPPSHLINPITGKLELPHYKPALASLSAEKEVYMSVMRCVRCKGIPAPPIKMCGEGHIYCRACAKVTRRCKSKTTSELNSWFDCDTEIEDMELPAFHFLYNTTNFVCPNEEFGCKVKPLGANLAKHITECTYKKTEESGVEAEATSSGAPAASAGGSVTSAELEVEDPAWKPWGSRYTNIKHKPGDISELGWELINLLKDN